MTRRDRPKPPRAVVIAVAIAVVVASFVLGGTGDDRPAETPQPAPTAS